MIKKIILFGVILGIIAISGHASAAVRRIHVDLSYPGVATAYNLYKDGVVVCVSNNSSASEMDCDVEIGSAPMTFALTAIDVDGVESPQSAPYVLTPPAMDPVTGNFIPQADFTVSGTSGEIPFLVSFDAGGSSDFDGMITSYDWNFGDGSEGIGELVDHTYTVPGTYEVLLTVVDDQGVVAEKTLSVTATAAAAVANVAPIASFSASLTQQGTSQLRLDATGSSDADGTIANYAWNFGDGESGVGKIVDHEFQAAGDYSVVLTVTDNAGATGTDQMVITVVEPPQAANVLPVAEISASTRKQLLHFEWEYSGTDPGLAGFRLYQNNNLVCEVADPAARQADCQDYVDNGQVRLWVTAFDQSGVESEASGALTFDSTGLFDASSGEAPVAVHFSAGTSTDLDGNIVAYAWNFGDGTVAEGMSSDHIYTIPGTYTVSVTVTDDKGGQAQATKTIAVTDATPPVAIDATFTTLQDKSVTATLSASDAEGSPLTYRITQGGSLGTASITNSATGVFTYVPKVGSFGSDTFSFKANDGTSDSNEATIAINIEKVNTPPTPLAKQVLVVEDGVLNSRLTARDIDGDVLTFKKASRPSHGTLPVFNTATGVFRYKPAANFYGTDSFTFIVNDGNVDSAPATVTITVTSVNDAPISTALTIATPEDVRFSGELPGADPDGDSLTYSIIRNGRFGKAVILDPATGGFTYKGYPNANGEDSFDYQISDGSLTAVATVTVGISPVNDSPRGALLNVSVGEGGRATGVCVGTDADGDPLTYSIIANGSKGNAVISDATTGAFTYSPNATATGKDSFSYEVSDGVLTANGTVTVTISPTSEQTGTITAKDFAVTAKEDSRIAGLLQGASTGERMLTYKIGRNGKLGRAVIVDPNTGAFTYKGFRNANGEDSFIYTVSDGVSVAKATVKVTISPVNDQPVAVDDYATVGLGQVVSIPALANDLDVDGDTLSIVSVTPPPAGLAEVVGGSIVYTADSSFSGTMSFTYTITDGAGKHEIGIVNLSVAK